ncbi:hypothetical protein C8R46DRAFT_1174927 [Mycena filopes]|nr:hypothetical protein C8R46DRAFT_1174927 [Mycena filopes]
MDAIFESLQREFCPPLDSSLLAALLADIVVDPSSTDVSDDPQITALRSTLIELAVHADEAAVPTDLGEDLYYDETTSGSSVLDFCTTTNTSTTSASDLSAGSYRSAALAAASSFNSPLGFLKAALPHIPTERLMRALASSSSSSSTSDQGEDDTAEEGDSELDMWELISALLSEETEKEMRERDLDEEELSALELAAATPWETVEPKRTTTAARKGKGKKKGKSITGTRIALSDVRQQQNSPAGRPGPPLRTRTVTESGLDPWAQLASLSTQIARFLPPHPPAFFQSYFHAPQYGAPYDALCAALSAISAASGSSKEDDDGDDAGLDSEHTATLFGLLDVLLPAYPSTSTPTESLITDVQLALKAAQGRGEDAFELVKVLRDLDDDRESGVWGVGVYHSPITSPLDSPSSFFEKGAQWGGASSTASRGSGTSTSTTTATLPAGPAPTPPPPNLRASPPGAPSKPKSAYQWQAVAPRRRATAPAVYPLAMRVPVYERDVNGTRVKRNGGSAAVDGGGEGAGDFRRRARESMRRRDELLREAARMWQRGNRRTMGGEVAWYFAERAREFQEVARREALDAARVMVSAKRTTPDTVDLHGVTAAEAVVIVDEILAEGGPGRSAEHPLKIITGRGTHSAGRVSVLKPAVRRALEEGGWVVGGWEGGLSVRGRVGGRR